MAITTQVIGNIVESKYDNVKETFPESVAPTGGTISTGYRLDQLIGVGTSFLSDLEKGDVIWFTTTDELADVIAIDGDLKVTLSREISGSLAGVAFRVVKKNGFKSISWLIDSANPALINTIEYPLGTSKSYGNDKPNGQGGGRRTNPVLVDSTLNGNIVYVSGE